MLISSATLAGPWIQTRKVAPSDTVRVGAVGINGMGWTNVRSHLKIPEVEVTALCDVDNAVLQKRSGELQDMTGSKADLYKDYRALIDDKDIDAIIVATPDHWHPLITMHACQAGKDVYVEKPLANSIGECDAMVAAAKHYKRVVQVGQWQRSGPHWDEAMAFVQSGKLDTIRTAKAWAYQGWMKNIPVRPDEETPEGVDYDLWLGPAPLRPFNPNRFHFTFRWFWDYAGGLMTDWGVHLIDMVLYGMDAVSPKSVLSAGGAFAYPDGGMETPDTQQAIFEYDGFSMIWEHAAGIDNGPYGRKHGVAFIGNNGTLVADRAGWEVIPEGERMAAVKHAKPKGARPGPAYSELRRLYQEPRRTELPARNSLAGGCECAPWQCRLQDGAQSAVGSRNAHLQGRRRSQCADQGSLPQAVDASLLLGLPSGS